MPCSALDRFPLIKRQAAGAPPSAWSLHRLRHAQDYLYDKTAILVTLHELVSAVHDLGLVWDVAAVPTRHSHTSVIPNVELSLLKQDSDDEQGSDTSLSADDSGFFDSSSLKLDFSPMKTSTHLPQATPEDLCDSLVQTLSFDDEASQPIAPARTSPPSMSRRRLASNLPVLPMHVALPPPPTSDELLSLNGALKSPRRSPGLTINPPSPRLDVDARPRSISLVMHSPDPASETLSPPAAALAVPMGLLSMDPPRTPIEQMMPALSQPPALPRRTGRSECPRSVSVGTCKPLESMPTPRPLPSPRLRPHTLLSPPDEEPNPFEVEATPRPSVRKARPLSFVLRPSRASGRFTPVSPLDLGHQRALDSPLTIGGPPPLVRTPFGQPATPFADAGVDSPNYFSARTYFAK
jgi:hypothetical protein